jgi:hypothetical protein
MYETGRTISKTNIKLLSCYRNDVQAIAGSCFSKRVPRTSVDVINGEQTSCVLMCSFYCQI